MVEIIRVQDKKTQKEFVEYPLRLYKGNPWFVPPLYGDEMKLFGEKNIYKRFCDSIFFIAQRNGKTVGRVQGIIQKQYNEIHGTKQARFTRFDCENNQETATALFDAVAQWARCMQMEELVGPLGYSDMEREGLLIEGFEYLSTFEEQYNYPYYAELLAGYGFEKDVDWVESRLFKMERADERLNDLGARALQKYNLHIAGEKMKKRAFVKKYADGVFDCIDECYKELYGVVPLSKEMRKQLVGQFMLILNREYIIAVCDENEKVVAFGFCLPGIGKAVQKSGGRLTPGCLVRLLKAIKSPDTIDLALVGILPEYRKAGVSAFMLMALQEMIASPSVQYMETNLNLETNTSVQAMWKRFESIQHKRRRSYIKKL